MLYDRVMRNIQNRHKHIKQMNSFINARFQRKLRKFAENPLSGSRSRLSGPTFRVSCLTSEFGPGSRVSGVTFITGPSYELSPGSRVLGSTNSPGSRVPLFGYAASFSKA